MDIILNLLYFLSYISYGIYIIIGVSILIILYFISKSLMRY